MKITRRKFIEGVSVLGLAAVFTPLLSRRAAAAPLRPPGAVPEKEFNARCIRCFKCGEVCPTGAIYFAGAGGIADTPIFKGQDQCTLCMSCIKACPSGALLPLAPLAKFDSHDVVDGKPVATDNRNYGVAQIRTPQCILYQDHRRQCLLCYKACPKPGEAIKVDELGRPVIDKVLCFGCGLCQQVCPPSAIDLPLKPATQYN